MPAPPPHDLAKAIAVGQDRSVSQHLETRVYGHVEADLQKWLNGSQFLTIKYGMINSEEILQRLSHLSPNWDSYGAPSPNANAVQASREVLKHLAENHILPTSIVASAEGGIAIYFMRGERSAYIESDNEGDQTLVLYGRQIPTEVLEVETEIPRTDISARLLRFLG
jgi:hypothetical protein